MKRPVDVVAVGDRIQFDGRIHVLAGLDGPRCRLLAEEDAGIQVVLLTQVLGAQDFDVLDQPRSGRRRAPVHGPLDVLDPAVREKALYPDRFGNRISYTPGRHSNPSSPLPYRHNPYDPGPTELTKLGYQPPHSQSHTKDQRN